MEKLHVEFSKCVKEEEPEDILYLSGKYIVKSDFNLFPFQIM